MARAVGAPKLCTICSKPLYRHQPCAICQSTHLHQRLCDFCKAQPENVDWDEARDDTVEYEDTRAVGLHLKDLQDRALRETTDIEFKILDLVARGVWVEVPKLDRLGRQRGVHRINRPITGYREVARLVGCDVAYVLQVLDRFLR